MTAFIDTTLKIGGVAVCLLGPAMFAWLGIAARRGHRADEREAANRDDPR